MNLEFNRSYKYKELCNALDLELKTGKARSLQINKIQEIQKQDKKVVLEISDVMEKVNNGFFEYSIKQKAVTKDI